MVRFLLHVPTFHPRIQYVATWIIRERWGWDLDFTTSDQEIASYAGPKASYGSVPLPDIPWLPATSWMLFSENVPNREDVLSNPWDKGIFTTDLTSNWSSDRLADIFWMLSRREEYTSVTDDHGRFPGRHSLAYRAGFLTRPVVDKWVAQLAAWLRETYPYLSFPPPHTTVQATFDIDFAWRYRHKPFTRQLRTWTGDVWRNGIPGCLGGMKTWLGLQADPFDCYAEWADRSAVLFFPLGDRSPFDRNHHWCNPAYQSLIRKWHQLGRAGIHPSYRSARQPERIQEEVERYRTITEEAPVRSRQHYLRWSFPDTPRALLAAGIQEDWTMGYADQPGFRAGTAFSFPWYDLRADQVTDLRLFPFQVMDGTLNRYLKLTPAEARSVIRQIRQAMADTGGSFTYLAHNNSWSGMDRDWQGWPPVFQEIH